jgi:hypothetical protein
MPMSGIRTHDPNVRGGKDVHPLDRVATVIGTSLNSPDLIYYIKKWLIKIRNQINISVIKSRRQA